MDDKQLFGGAIAALFAALVAALRQRGEDWKGLYDNKEKELAQVRLEAAEDQRENAAAIRELAAFIHELPRRREDWAVSQQPASGSNNPRDRNRS